jgi:hypothetical protein
VMLAQSYEIDAELVGEHGFLDNLSEDLCMVFGFAIGGSGEIAKGVEAELDLW